jgi:predicted CXXCH cytochrome family protein
MGSAEDIEIILRDCLACHDGTLAGSIGRGKDHIDVAYLAGKDYNAVIDRRIILVNGRVTCISCHNPYSTEAYRLAMPNNRSRLCLECHRK